MSSDMPEIELSETLLIDKPANITSHDVVDAIRRVYKTRRVGHAGTLDPFATGLLIVAVGKATKDIQLFVGLNKTYEATARLGAISNTYDLTGRITQNSQFVTCNAESDVSSYKLQVTRDEVVQALMSFKGGYAQKAPAYSAKKVRGQKLYEMARRGEDVEHLRPIKNVDISEIELIDYKWPDVTFRVTCSSGTYIRSLAHDLGEKLGCGAYLTELRRTRIGEYKVEDAKQLKELDNFTIL